MSLFDGKTLDGWQGDVKALRRRERHDGVPRRKPLHGQGICQLHPAVRVQAAARRQQRRRHPHAAEGRRRLTPAWRSRSSTTAIRDVQRLPPALAGPRLDLRRGAGETRLPQARRPVEPGGDRRRRKPHQGHAQRHGDHRRRLEQDRQDDGPPRPSRACTTPRATSAGSATAIRWRSAMSASSRCRKPRQLSPRAAQADTPPVPPAATSEFPARTLHPVGQTSCLPRLSAFYMADRNVCPTGH